MLETERLIIRKFVAEDYADLYEYLSLPITYEYEPGEPIDLETAKKMVQERIVTDNFLAVELKAERKLIGHIYFAMINPGEFLTWELGYIFNPNYQKKGYASEAVRRLLEFVFANKKAHKVTAYCNCENTASWRLLERVGMKREGLLRKNVYFKKDESGIPLWVNSYCYGMLKEDIK